MLMLILFVGVFVIGSIQVVSLDLQNQLATTTNQELSYNVIAKVPQNQTQTMHSQLTHLSGLVASYSTTIAATTIEKINNRPWKSFLTSADTNIQVSSGSPVDQKIDPTQATQAQATLRKSIPDVSFVTTSATRVDAYLQGLSTISWIFTIVGSLVLLAGIIVMANAIILDMGERRRELGVLKAIGYTQKTLQQEILLEYGLIGGLSAILADLLITLFSNFFGNSFLHAISGDLSNTGTTVTFMFSTSGLLLTYLIIGAILLVITTSLLTSWRTMRIRPLDVLR
ncbi:hypothetical protein ccbrp13_32420 [Ktedonobacteria bacterium brp13]|nr:hypothetical protein ccbrp13_32420 [Ktedonobacteria bacterium brp13]